MFYPFKRKGTQNVKPFRYCLSCWRSQPNKVNAVQTNDDSYYFMQQNTQVITLISNKQTMLNNTFFDKRHLRRTKTLDHPRASIKVTKYGTNKFALADTFAQSTLWGWKNFQDAGFGKNDLLTVSVTILAANKIPENISALLRLMLVECLKE